MAVKAYNLDLTANPVDYITDYTGDWAITCLIVSHSPIALANADRVVVLDDGRVVNP